MADASSTLMIQSFVCKNFRCFSQLEVDLAAPLILCENANGSGKTSFLEALYYAGHLRSFRTPVAREMTQFGKDNFFVKLSLCETNESTSLYHDVQVGFSQGKRIAKVNQQEIQSRRELANCYRVSSITEDDLQLVKGAPEFRRDFIDSVAALYDPNHRGILKAFRYVLQQRNAFLASGGADNGLYEVLSRQLFELSQAVQAARQKALEEFNKNLQQLLTTDFGNYHIELIYEPKEHLDADYFGSGQGKTLFFNELRMKRTLWGAHLDDCAINFNAVKSRTFASRGQQKLIVVLMKLAYLTTVFERYGKVVVLLDDFATDLDATTAQIMVTKLLRYNNQLVFTAPTNSSSFSQYLRSVGAQAISIAS
jgi:DNA replication and repair protein RecF